jgi:Major capsid protein N-terminus/Large eukaryotic DNA virus major capsid protein
MPGGLMQLTGIGAQNVFVNGNPSMSYFSKMYKRSTNFAMEHFRLDPRNSTDTNLAAATKSIYRFKVSRYADLLHDCHLCVNIPDIWSGLSVVDQNGNAKPFLFQWVRNLGYNMIEEASVIINGSAVSTVTGEWMKIQSYLSQDKTKRELLDQMVGNIPEIYDPANAPGRFNQYPNAIATPSIPIPGPSIRGRQLVIPLSFWFCTEIGQSLPLIALSLSEVEISITFTNIYSLFTVMDVDPTSLTYGQRIVGDPGNSKSSISNFLSYPDVQGNPTNPDLQNWNLTPYIEANYIFVTDTERAHIAAFERTFLMTQVRYVYFERQYGYYETPIPMFNLCTRIVALFQRMDRTLLNDWDNYTNWNDIFYPPIDNTLIPVGANNYYSSGAQLPNNMIQQDILQEASIVFDGKEREVTKNVNFYREIENFQYSKGDTTGLPGINLYSFSLKPDEITQPSGSVNGSMFNRTNLRYTLLVPPTVATGVITQTPICVVKSSVFSPNPTPVPPGATVSPAPGIPPLISPGEVIQIYPQPTNLDIQYGGYLTTVYIESYNFLKVTNGQANVVFNT